VRTLSNCFSDIFKDTFDSRCSHGQLFLSHCKVKVDPCDLKSESRVQGPTRLGRLSFRNDHFVRSIDSEGTQHSIMASSKDLGG
jgi:hypothetical protein